MCCCDALKSTITTPIVVIGNIVAFIMLVAIFATPEWYNINASPPPIVKSSSINNSTTKSVPPPVQPPAAINNSTSSFVWRMGAIYYCYNLKAMNGSKELVSEASGGSQIDITVSNNIEMFKAIQDFQCVVQFHSVQQFMECKNATFSDTEIASCGSTEVIFFLLYAAFFLNLVTGALTFLMCCTKCVTCGCCGNSFSFLAVLPAGLGLLCLLISVIISVGNLKPYAAFLLSNGFLANSIWVNGVVDVGMSFYFGLIATAATFVTTLFLVWDAKSSALDCCAKGADSYALW